MENINFKWFTTDDFLNLQPINVFGKELTFKAEESPIKNYHCLARAKYYHKGGAEVKMQISADDYYKLYINGIYVTEGPAPSFHSGRFYNEINISDYLSEGENIIATHLYYQGEVNRVWQSGDNRFGIACLINGENLIWKYALTKVFSGHYVGYKTAYTEDFDSNKFNENWCLKDFDDGDWKSMTEKAHDYTFRLQETKQLSVYSVKPKSKIGNIYDFGSEVVGCLKIKAKGVKGDTVIIHCGEELNDDGSVRFNLRAFCNYEETWTLADGECIFENYDYKAFRYVEILSENAEILDFEVRVRHYPFDENYCVLESNDKTLVDVFNICKNGVKWGTQDGFLDCPSREKGQYLGDTFVIAHSHLILTGDNKMLRKAIDDFAATSQICKGLMAVSSSSFMQEIADFSLIYGELLLLDYSFSGDKEFLAKYYSTAKNIILYFKEYENENGLLCNVTEKWNLVDWPDNLRDGYDFPLTRPITSEKPHNVLNAYYIGAIQTLNKIEEILGLETSFDVEKIKNSYQKSFFDTKLYKDAEDSKHHSLHSNVLPLYFNLVPEENKENIVDFIMEKGFSCGVYMGYFVLKALTRNGKYTEAYKLIVNESEHGWVNMLREGATCCFEAWGKDQKANTSLCHPWGSAPVIVIAEDLVNQNIPGLVAKIK